MSSTTVLTIAHGSGSLTSTTTQHRSSIRLFPHRDSKPVQALPPFSKTSSKQQPLQSKKPNSGILSLLPEPIVPYAELLRLHKFAGYYASGVPLAIGLLFAAAIRKDSISIPLLLSTATRHAIGNVFLRGAGCSWNDTIDAPLDRLVARCKSRPVARGAVSTSSAHIFTALVTATWLAILSPFPTSVYPPAIAFLALLALYPFCKRFTNFPQIVLGFAVGLGQTTAMSSLGVDLFTTESSSAVKMAAACLYFSNVVNAMIYDTVYAHQDLKDDLKAGVMSMAVFCQGRAKAVLSFLSVVEVGLLILTGLYAGLEMGYFIVACGGTALVLTVMLTNVDLSKPAECLNWFKWILWFTGAAICAGLGMEYVH